LKCTNCNNYTLIDDAPKTTAARVSIMTNEEQLSWYTILPNMINLIIQQHNNTCNPTTSTTLDNLEEDKLSETLLLSRNTRLQK